MLNGLYRCFDDGFYKQYDILIKVKETDKTYVLELIENNSKYSPAHIDMLFVNNNKAIIKKENSKHAIRSFGDSDFVIYPFRLGVPFLFEKESDKENI